MSSENFENKYWERHNQRIVFRHKAALELIKEGPILDLGCGDGLFLSLLKEKGITGVGLEISEVAVRKAMRRGLDVRKFDFTENKLPFKDNSFEAVVLLDVLEHLYQPEKILREIHRVTKESIILSVPNFNSLPARLQMIAGYIPENNTPIEGHIYWFSYTVLKNLLKENDFDIKIIKVNSFFSWTPILKSLMHLLARIWPSLFALNFVIKVKKL